MAPDIYMGSKTQGTPSPQVMQAKISLLINEETKSPRLVALLFCRGTGLHCDRPFSNPDKPFNLF